MRDTRTIIRGTRYRSLYGETTKRATDAPEFIVQRLHQGDGAVGHANRSGGTLYTSLLGTVIVSGTGAAHSARLLLRQGYSTPPTGTRLKAGTRELDLPRLRRTQARRDAGDGGSPGAELP